MTCHESPMKSFPCEHHPLHGNATRVAFIPFAAFLGVLRAFSPLFRHRKAIGDLQVPCLCRCGVSPSSSDEFPFRQQWSPVFDKKSSCVAIGECICCQPSRPAGVASHSLKVQEITSLTKCGAGWQKEHPGHNFLHL